jgi:hypothetical protein
MSSKTVSSYLGVWRTGTGEQRWFTGSKSDIAVQDAAFFKQGLRLVAIDRHTGSFIDGGGIHLEIEDRMIAVWRPGTGAQHWSTGMSFDQLKAADAEYLAKGLRLVALDSDDGAFTAVWRAGTGPHYWHVGLSGPDFTAKDKAYFAQGLRLVAVDLDDGKLAGVWRPGTGAQQWLSASVSAIIQKNQELLGQGLRVTAIDHKDDNAIAVWHAGTGAEYWYMGMTVDEFKQKDAELLKQGLRLVAVDLGTKTIQVADPAPAPAPGAAVRHLTLNENEPYSGAGGNSSWMYYSANVAANDPAKSHAIKKIKNPSSYAMNLSHTGGAVNLPPHGETDAFNGGTLPGTWSAELLGVSGEFAPSVLGIDITLS